LAKITLEIDLVFAGVPENSAFLIEGTGLSTLSTTVTFFFDNYPRPRFIINSNSIHRTDKVAIWIRTLPAHFDYTLPGERIPREGDSGKRWTTGSLMVQRTNHFTDTALMTDL
jgi:hypothetical protein